MKQTISIIALAVAITFSSCKKDNQVTVCMESVDNNGNVTSAPFKQTKAWAERHTDGTHSFSYLDDSACR